MCLSRELGNLANRNFEVLLKLDRMNRALRVYWQAMSEDEGQVADVVFADCYDWLVARSVSIYYDEKPKLWMLRLY